MIESGEVPIKCKNCQHWFFWERKCPSDHKPIACSRKCANKVVESKDNKETKRYAARSFVRKTDPFYVEAAIRDVMRGYREEY